LLPSRRQVIHLNPTAHPTAAWTARQLIEAFPEGSATRYLLRDRDQIYGAEFRLRVKGMQIEEVITAPQSHFQIPYPERAICHNCRFHRFPLVAEVCSALRSLFFFTHPCELAANHKFPQIESRNFPSAESCF